MGVRNSENIKTFFTELTKYLEQFTNSYDHIIIKWDININTKDNLSPGYQIYKNFLDTSNLKNLIKSDTCYTKRNGNLPLLMYYWQKVQIVSLTHMSSVQV